MSAPTALRSRVKELIRHADRDSGIGQTFYVDSVNGSVNNDGKTSYNAKATLMQAIALTTANQCDRIVVMPKHVETIATAAAIDATVAGVTITGLGKGADRPLFTMSATGSTLAISAASVTLENLIFKMTAAVVIAIDVNAADCVCKDLVFRNTTTSVATTCIDINGGGANACDRTQIINCVCDMGASNCARFVELGEVCNGVEITGCKVFGAFTDACIHNPTGKVLTNLTIADSRLTNNSTGNHSIELVSACTGNLENNRYHNDMTQATGVDPGSCFSFNCYQCDVVDTSGILTPVAT